jgi:Tfp pilus assembly protein PilO
MIKHLIPYRAYLYLTFLFVCIAGATIYYIVFMPMNDQIEEKNQVLQTRQNDVNRLLEQLDKTTQEPESDTLNILMQSIPFTPHVQQIILDIEQVENQTGVNVSNISFNNEFEDIEQELLSSLEAKYPGVQTVKMSTISFNLEVTTDYLSLMQFFTRISSLPRTIHINQIEYQSQVFESPVEETAAPEISAVIRLSAYYSEHMGKFVNEDLDIDVNDAVRRDNPLYFSTEKK